MNNKYREFTNEKPLEGLKYEHPYKVEGPLLQSLQGENPQFFEVLDLDLTVAQPFTSALSQMDIQGHGIVIYGYTKANKYDPIANTGIEPIQTSAFIACRFQQNSGANNQTVNEFHLKHNRGFWGPFNRIYLAWPAQANVAAKVYIFKNSNRPFNCGEAAT